MLMKDHIFTIDTHTAGEPTRIVISGIKPVPGATMMEKKHYLTQNYDRVRNMLMREPRGHKDMFGAIVLPPAHAEADVGVVFMHCNGFQDMCGHGSIGAITALLETGYLPMVEPYTTVVLDTPSGLVYGKALIKDGHVVNVSIQNVPSFLYSSDVQVETPGFGSLKVDIVFSGNFFALLNLDQLKMNLSTENLPTLLELGMAVKTTLNRQMKPVHPLLPDINTVELVEIYQKPPTGNSGKNVVIFGEGQFDRSPCGTGTCAMLSRLYAQGKITLNETYENKSIIDTVFEGRVIQEIMLKDIPAVIPEITGQAYITGIQQFMYNADDPLKYGFVV